MIQVQFVDKPKTLDLRANAKYDVWVSKKGMSKDDAMKQYIERVDILVAAIGLQCNICNKPLYIP